MLESPNLLFSLKLLLMAPHRFLLRLENFCAGHLFFRKLADGLFLKCCKETAEKYPDIEFNNVIIDNASMQVVSNPWQFDVMVMPNLYGNILGKFGCLTSQWRLAGMLHVYVFQYGVLCCDYPSSSSG